jgi:hypothetical protein
MKSARVQDLIRLGQLEIWPSARYAYAGLSADGLSGSARTISADSRSRVPVMSLGPAGQIVNGPARGSKICNELDILRTVLRTSSGVVFISTRNALERENALQRMSAALWSAPPSYILNIDGVDDMIIPYLCQKHCDC